MAQECEWCGGAVPPRVRRGGKPKRFCTEAHGREAYKALLRERNRQAKPARIAALPAPELSVDKKTCRRCGEIKSIDEFHRSRSSRDGHTAWCAECGRKHSQRYRDIGPQGNTPRDCLNCGEIFTPPERKPGERGRPPVCCGDECQDARTKSLIEAAAPERAYQAVLRRYNLTDARYKAMLAAQGGRCKGCGADSPGESVANWNVDHDHSCCPAKRSCGRCVRGLVCTRCNLILGLAGDSVPVLERLIAYLKATAQPELFALAGAA